MPAEPTITDSSHTLGQEPIAASVAREWRDDRDRLQAIMDNCTAVIYLKDLGGRYLFINLQFEKLFHVTRAGILSKTDFDIFDPAHAAAFRANDVKVVEAGKAMEWEEVAPHDDGPHDYVSLKFPMRDADGTIYGVCGISSDITEFKRVQEELNRFFGLTLDLLCIADFSGCFRRVNPAWEHTLGWTAEQLVSRPYLEFVHPDDRAATLAEADKVAAGATTLSFENRYLCADGTYRWLLWNAMPLPAQQLIYCAARDITPRKLADKKLAETLAELERSVGSERAASERLKKALTQLVQAEKMMALGQMVAGVAHEINNPMSYVANNMAVLERDLTSLRELLTRYQRVEHSLDQPEAFREVHEYAESIDAAYTLANLDGIVVRTKEGLKRIQHIVRDLREFARESDKDWHEVDLNAGIASTVNIVKLRAAKKKVIISTELGQLPRVQCQPAKINQVVLNLVSNAIDACQPGGNVTVRTRQDGARGVIEIVDDGSGIDPAIRERIFDPFFTTKPPGMGTGLGLSITHSIVEEHRGSIAVDSAVGAGSRFVVRLPARSSVP